MSKTPGVLYGAVNSCHLEDTNSGLVDETTILSLWLSNTMRWPSNTHYALVSLHAHMLPLDTLKRYGAVECWVRCSKFSGELSYKHA